MPANEHLVLCGGVTRQGSGDAARLELNLHGTSANVRLEIEDISRRLLANISDVHADLLEVASYIYAADAAIPRGGKTDPQIGARRGCTGSARRSEGVERAVHRYRSGNG